METMLAVLIESSVRATLLATAVAGVIWGARVKSPAIRHRAWTCVLLAMLFLPVVSLWVPRVAIPVLPSNWAFRVLKSENSAPAWKPFSKSERALPTAAGAHPDESGPAESSTVAAHKNRSASPLGPYVIAAILYLAGFLVLVTRLLIGMLLSFRLSRNAFLDGRGFHRSQCTVPLTVGLWHARILLPADSNHWDADKLNAVLVHEQAHVNRRDPLVEWLALLNRSLYWFHPLAWWLCGKLASLAEQACDDAVLASGHDRGAYAELLLGFARSVKQRGALVTPWGSSIHGSELARRIRRIVTAGLSPAISRTRLILVTALCAGATLVAAACELVSAHAAPFGPPIISAPASSAAQPDSTTVRYQSNRSNPPIVPDKTLYETGSKYLANHEYIRARLAFQTLINTYPGSDFTASSYFAIADSFYGEEDTEDLIQAKEQYKNFVVFFPTHPKAAEAQMKVVSIDMKMRRLPDPTQPSVQNGTTEVSEPYSSWLNEHVGYIITTEEKTAFLSLITDMERDEFITQFWLRRGHTEFKQEHYRRLAYANQHFAASVAGWQTDRGRIYILYGPPTEIEAHPYGGTLVPEISAGVMDTAVTFPFELWRYDHIDGIGAEIKIVFVDRTGTGDYRIYTGPTQR